MPSQHSDCNPMPAIVVQNLSKTYTQRFKPPVTALRNISFSVGEGEVVGLIGPNGAGKSTLMRLMLGFVPSDSGSVTLFGEHPESLRARSMIGYQADTQFRSANVTLGQFFRFHAALIGIPSPNEHIQSLLRTFALHDMSDRTLASLSKGMRQKAELILAFLGTPKLVFLDEPTAALDPPSVFALRDFLAEQKRTGMTVMFSSHHLSEVESVCDRIIFISDGTLLDDTPISEIKPGHLEKLFRENYKGNAS